jgi:N-carbamoylputrescine amidase
VAQAPSAKAILLMASIDLDKCAEAPARELFLRHRRPDQYERGAVTLSGSVPAHSNALAASADGEEEGES